MSKVTLYGIRNCDTMKKARTWLADQGVEYIFHDYKKSGIDAVSLQRWADQVGWETLLNRRGTSWRKVPEDTRIRIDRDSAIALMQQTPSMIKRPVLDVDGKIHIGFNADQYANVFT